MTEPTVEQVLSLDESKHPQRNPSAIPTILALFFLPPLGVFLAWKEKSHHHIYAIYVGILGVINLILGIWVYLVVYPELRILYEELEVTFNESTFTIQLTVAFLFGLLQIVIAYLAYRKAKTNHFLENTWLVSLTVLLAVHYFIQPFLISSVITTIILPIYESSVGSSGF